LEVLHGVDPGLMPYGLVTPAPSAQPNLRLQPPPVTSRGLVSSSCTPTGRPALRLVIRWAVGFDVSVTRGFPVDLQQALTADATALDWEEPAVDLEDASEQIQG